MSSEMIEDLLRVEFVMHPEMRIEDIKEEDTDVDRVDYEMHREKDNEAIEEAESRIL